MPDPYRRPYLDSSVYIAAIKGEQDRAETAKHILKDAEDGKLQIVGSTFVIAEVIRAKGQPPLSEADEHIIDQYVMRESMVWVELDVSLALEARRIARDHNLKPAESPVQARRMFPWSCGNGWRTKSATFFSCWLILLATCRSIPSSTCSQMRMAAAITLPRTMWSISV